MSSMQTYDLLNDVDGNSKVGDLRKIKINSLAIYQYLIFLVYVRWSKGMKL